MSRVKPLKSGAAESPPRSHGMNMPAGKGGGKQAVKKGRKEGKKEGGKEGRKRGADAAPTCCRQGAVAALPALAARRLGLVPCRLRHVAAAGESLGAEGDHPPAAAQGGTGAAGRRRRDFPWPSGGSAGPECDPGCHPAAGGGSAR